MILNGSLNFGEQFHCIESPWKPLFCLFVTHQRSKNCRKTSLTLTLDLTILSEDFFESPSLFTNAPLTWRYWSFSLVSFLDMLFKDKFSAICFSHCHYFVSFMRDCNASHENYFTLALFLENHLSNFFFSCSQNWQQPMPYLEQIRSQAASLGLVTCSVVLLSQRYKSAENNPPNN